MSDRPQHLKSLRTFSTQAMLVEPEKPENPEIYNMMNTFGSPVSDKFQV